jgi:hypothetical protein
MKRALVIFVSCLVAGCASDLARKPAADSKDAADVGTSGNPPGRTVTPETTEQAQVTGAPYDRAAGSKDAPVSSEPERDVDLPGSVELTQSPPTLPSMPRVAVAFVRGGKLVRRADALRKLSHGFEREAHLEAIERLADEMPARVNLDVLVARAEKQGALLLLLDVRKTDDAERTTYLVTAKAAWEALAFTQPNATEPAGQELVARLVRSARGNP